MAYLRCLKASGSFIVSHCGEKGQKPCLGSSSIGSRQFVLGMGFCACIAKAAGKKMVEITKVA